MKKLFLLATLIALLTPVGVLNARRVVLHRARVVVRPGFPIRRTLPAAVVVRAPRRPVVVAASLAFLPAVVWAATAAPLPPRERLVWQDSESFAKDEDWVESNFGVDTQGNALYFELQGRAQLNYAEVVFSNGQAQVVDFNSRVRDAGIYRLLDFADGRHVKTVKILACAKSREAKITVYMAK